MGNCLKYNAVLTKLGVEVTSDEYVTVARPGQDVPKRGPCAPPLLKEVADGDLLEITFFRIADLKSAGKDVRALRHGVAGRAGFETYGPWDSQQKVRERVEKAWVAYGLGKAGSVTYPTAAQESGRMPRPFPAIYTGEPNRVFRERLLANSFERNCLLGGMRRSLRVKRPRIRFTAANG